MTDKKSPSMKTIIEHVLPRMIEDPEIKEAIRKITSKGTNENERPEARKFLINKATEIVAESTDLSLEVANPIARHLMRPLLFWRNLTTDEFQSPAAVAEIKKFEKKIDQFTKEAKKESSEVHKKLDKLVADGDRNRAEKVALKALPRKLESMLRSVASSVIGGWILVNCTAPPPTPPATLEISQVTPERAASVPQGKRLIVTNDGADVRTRPSITKGKLIRKLKKNDAVKFIDQSGAWKLVELFEDDGSPGLIGWVYSAFFAKEFDISELEYGSFPRYP